jgi:hypothetical protein
MEHKRTEAKKKQFEAAPGIYLKACLAWRDSDKPCTEHRIGKPL